MRLGENEEQLRRAFVMARNEAKAAFDDPSVYLEKYIQRPRHVEIQVMGDQHGEVVHFGERDCSVQRRHQKLIEESPSPALDEDLRRRMGDAAVRAG
jgi:acetyl-CoA carboxylase biotin carboxylase subunit